MVQQKETTMVQQITENSLYTSNQEKEELLKDKEKVASAFFINFLGTLGLFAISSSRGIMKTHFQDDGKVQLVNIGDANKDVSLVVKLYNEIGGLKSDVANKITRLLFKLKSRAITSKTLDENSVREIVKGIQYLSHRPHPLILNIVKQFESGNASLKQVGKAFYNLIKTRKKDFLPISQEFYSIAKQYLVYFKNIPDIGIVTSFTDTKDEKSIQTIAQHSSEPVSHVIDQKANSDSIQTVAKPVAISDEDFYLMLWKATSKNEINKLLKERGYDSFTLELMEKACNYLLPSTSTNNEHFDMVINAMPDIETFNKAFGYFMKNNIYYIKKWRMVLLYKISLSKSAAEIKKKLILMRLYIRKLFEKFDSEMLNGKTKNFLKNVCFNVVINDFQKRIASATASDNVNAMFELFYKELNELSVIFGEQKWVGDLSFFYDGNTLSETEKIKYLIAYLSKARKEYSYVILKLIPLLKKQGIFYIEQNVNMQKTILIPHYENIFPGSKECIDAWYKDVDHNYLQFGVSNIYDIIAKEWKLNLETALIKNFDQIPETESDTDIVNKIVSLIDQEVKSEKDKYILFEKIAKSYSFGAEDYFGNVKRASRIAGMIQVIYANRFKNEIEQGKFKLDSEQINQESFIKTMFELIGYDFRKEERIGNAQWKAYVGMMKALLMKSLFVNDNELRIKLLKMGLKGDYEGKKVISYLNGDDERMVRIILNDLDEYIHYSNSKDILISPNSAQYLKEEDYKKLAKKIDIDLFIRICNSHKIDPYKYLSNENIKQYIITMFLNSGTDITRTSMFKDIFNHLKEDDRIELINKWKEDVFVLNKYYNKILVSYAHLKRLRYLLGDSGIAIYLNNLDMDKKKLLLVSEPDFFFSYITNDNMNATLSEFFDDPSLIPSSMGRNVFLSSALKRKNDITVENVKKIVNAFSNYDRKLKPSQRREFEQAYYKAIEILENKSKESANEVFMQMPLDERKSLVRYLFESRFVSKALESIQGDNVLIKPLTPVTEERLLEILKYNNIQVPRRPVVKEKDKLSEILSKPIDALVLKELHVNQDILSEEELERMSVEYDSFNHYKHGNIALKIRRAFSVSVPIQEEGFKNWVERMYQEGIDPKIMKPVFHGTGSIGASMILRYGFKVIKSNDPLVVGRMLGDGIYFSNVLDKVGQYIGDSGYSRTKGTQGYIFEMEASLGKHPRDYRSAGTGAIEDDRRTVSPEWVVYNPNEQLRIYKAYHVEIISKDEMDKLKKKHLGTNESSVVEIKSFKSFINEGANDMSHCITYIFMDGSIPVSDKESVDFKDFNARKFGKHVKLDWTGSGPSVMIYNNKESKTFVVRYTREFMEDKDELEKYLKLLKK